MDNSKQSFALIIYSGFSKESFDNEILEKVIQGLDERNKKYNIIDLVADKFNPTFEGKDLRLYSQGKTTDENVIKYQKLLKNCNELIFIYKIENNSAPALTKGFLDKTFLSNGFWYLRKAGWFDALWGECQWIKSTRVLAYQEQTKSMAKRDGKSSYKTAMTKGTLFALKMKKIRMTVLSDYKDEIKQEKFLDKIAKTISKKGVE